jgi:hypothetical protein
MPRWLNWLRGETPAQQAPTVIAPPDELVPGLPSEPPPGVDGALWSSWASRWQEF